MKNLKEEIASVIDTYADEILAAAKELLQHPELGYKEEWTKKFTEQFFTEHGIEYTSGHALTGVKGRIKGKESKVSVCIIGEMDAVSCTEHPYADRITSAAHACGHHIQMANMLGAALAFSKSGIMKELFGDVVFMAVPAEEFIELEYRQALKKQGKIQYFGGKQQLICEGAFDDIDMAMMIHSHPDTKEDKLFFNGKSLGFVAKTITYTGKETHASTPGDGVNALNAAMIGLMSIHANRDTFKEEDRVRVHPIITYGGDIVNTIPATVKIETYVRASNAEAIQSTAAVVDNCMKAGALALGAQVEIADQRGYLPLLQDKALSEVFEHNAGLLMDKENIYHNVDMIGSSDIGDLSHLIPCIQPTIGGFCGTAHSSEFMSCSEKFNIIDATKMLCFTVIDLMDKNAELGCRIKDDFKPAFTKEEYLKYLENVEG